MNGGAMHHSIRIVLPRSSAKNMTHVVRGDVIFTVQKGAFILLGTDTVYNVTGCTSIFQIFQIFCLISILI